MTNGTTRAIAFAFFSLLFLLMLAGGLPFGRGVEAQGVVIGGCQIQQFTQCENADMSKANLSNYNFTGANLFDANLSNTTIDGADFTYAYLNGVDFSGARLSYVNFTGAVLVGANMSGASLSNPTWEYTLCPDGTTSEQNSGTCDNHLGSDRPSGSATCNIGDPHNCGGGAATATPTSVAGCSPIDPRCGTAATPTAVPGCSPFDPRCGGQSISLTPPEAATPSPVPGCNPLDPRGC
jgi:Pentapeptide repeats (9 copies)